jgi:hypothetical protein
VCRDCLRLACPLKHKQLREYSNCFEIYGEGPEDLGRFEVVVEYEGEDDTGSQKIFDLERVKGWVVCWPIGDVSRGKMTVGSQRGCPPNESCIRTGSGTS